MSARRRGSQRRLRAARRDRIDRDACDAAAAAGRRRRCARSGRRAADHGRAGVNTGQRHFAYSQARLQARLGQSADPADLQRAHAARDLAGFLAVRARHVAAALHGAPGARHGSARTRTAPALRVVGARRRSGALAARAPGSRRSAGCAGCPTCRRCRSSPAADGRPRGHGPIRCWAASWRRARAARGGARRLAVAAAAAALMAPMATSRAAWLGALAPLRPGQPRHASRPGPAIARDVAMCLDATLREAPPGADSANCSRRCRATAAHLPPPSALARSSRRLPGPRRARPARVARRRHASRRRRAGAAHEPALRHRPLVRTAHLARGTRRRARLPGAHTLGRAAGLQPGRIAPAARRPAARAR